MTAPPPLRLLVLGTGGMAANHAEAFARIPGVALAGAVEPRTAVRQAFCDRFGIGRGFDTLAAALDWGGFDAAANVTPDAVHHATTLPLLAAGKHVLCEKPLATRAVEAAEMAAAAARAGVVHMVNLSYRRVPALQAARRLVAAGAIGELRQFEASYLQSWLVQPAWGDWRQDPQWLWRLSTAHGSKGVLGDVGIHILDFATFAAGEAAAEVGCRLATFDKAPGGRIGDYRLDANDSAAMVLRLAGGAVGTVAATRFAAGHLNDLKLRLWGTAGGIEAAFEHGASRLRVCLGPDVATATWRGRRAPAVPSVYETFVAAIRGRAAADPDFGRGAALQRLLDRAEDSAAQGGVSLPV